MKKKYRIYNQVKASIGSFFLLVLFLGTQKVFSEISVQKEESSYLPLKILAQSLNLIETHYPQKKERKELVHGAIQGMLFELDPYSHLLTPMEIEKFKNQSQSFIKGFGISLHFKNHQPIITSVFENSEAYKKGVQVGDVLTSINDHSIQNMSYDEIVHRIETSSSLKLKVARAKNQSISFNLSKGSFQIPSLVVKKINDQLLYVKILSFRENSYKSLKRVLNIQRKPKGVLSSQFEKGVLLDLRQNSGGIVQEALLMADLFTPDGVLISIQDQKNSQKFYAKSLGTLNDIPLVVLIDEYTASASEILAVSLKENERAFVVGQKSFGKGSIQTLFEIENGYALKLTISEYFSPLGKAIEKTGVEPHLYLNSQASLKEEEVQKINHFKYNFTSQKSTSRDESIGPIRSEWKKQIENDPILKKSFEVLKRLSF